jgi:hypothetical protein
MCRPPWRGRIGDTDDFPWSLTRSATEVLTHEVTSSVARSATATMRIPTPPSTTPTMNTMRERQRERDKTTSTTTTSSATVTCCSSSASSFRFRLAFGTRLRVFQFVPTASTLGVPISHGRGGTLPKPDLRFPDPDGGRHLLLMYVHRCVYIYTYIYIYMYIYSVCVCVHHVSKCGIDFLLLGSLLG